MNTLTAFNRCVEIHTDIETNPEKHMVQAINDFDNYTVDVAEALIADICDGDAPAVERQASLARLRVIAEIRMDIQELLVRKAFGMGKRNRLMMVH